MTKRFLKIFYLILILLMASCARNEHFRYPAKKWQVDNDRQPIAMPKVDKNYLLLDEAEKQIYEQIKIVSSMTYAIQPSHLLTLSGKQPALNTNNFDEVPDCTWFTNYLGRYDLSEKEIIKQIKTRSVPDITGNFLVKGAEAVGEIYWLLVKDEKEKYFLLKFHSLDSISKEIVSLSILRLAGYNVPDVYYLELAPSQLILDSKAKHRDKYGKLHGLSDKKFEKIKEELNHREKITAMAISSVDGKILGPFSFSGRRYGDFNDRVPHEHRRELRALSIFFALLDVKMPIEENTMDTFVVNDDPRGYLKHYLFDVEANVGKQEEFDPEKWRPSYPNPAFLFLTDQDAFWAAKMIVRLTDEKLKTIVHLARFSDQQLAKKVEEDLKERRDKIGSYWFKQVNPLDNFDLSSISVGQRIVFDDLAIDHGFSQPEDTIYRFRLQSRLGRIIFTDWQTIQKPEFNLTEDVLAKLDKDQIYVVRIETKRKASQWWSQPLDLFIKKDGQKIIILGLERK
ncbi:MAG: hypothetical protein ABH859_08205 [Pseudomonadota bacterium]